MTRIVQMTTAHSARDIRIFHKECRSLAKGGYDVSLIVQDVESGSASGVQIVALASPRSRRERMTHLVASAYLAARRERAALFHFHDPELLPVGILLKLTGRRVVYDVHEDLPKQILHKQWIPAWARRPTAGCIALIEWAAARMLDGVVTATPAIARRFDARRTVTVQNYPLLDELVVESGMPYKDRAAVVVYVGGIQEVRGAREMLAAVERAGQAVDVRLELAGEFYPTTLENELRQSPAWQHVRYHGTVGRPQVAELMSRARIGLVLFHPLPNHVEAQPNKLFEYMSAGIPVIASDFPLWRDIVGEAKCGLLVDPCDPSAIAEAIRWLLDHPEDAERMGQNGKEAVRTRYNWERESEQLLGFYKTLLAS